MLRRMICLCLALTLLAGNALALRREELRAGWQALVEKRSAESPYDERPDVGNFTMGTLREDALQDALALTNFLRQLAGLEAVTLDSLYTLRAQACALLLAANDELTHAPAQPEGMPDALYETGYLGASQGNIAKFNWMRNDILIDGVTRFARDDGAANLATLGHRRWLLNPCMAATGFGLANAASGNSYIAMYAVDAENSDATWDCVCWPAAGTFPVELMRSELPWSISLNPELYDSAASDPVLTLTEETSGARFRFDFLDGSGDGYCRLSTERCGSGDCLIFLPELAAAGIGEYVQNQRWTVEVSGLRSPQGEAKELRYSCEMASVYPQDVANVELDVLEATLRPGEELQLQADVIPAYADDLHIAWHSSDPTVASVSVDGRVRAINSGACEIIAQSANGRQDSCNIQVQ